MATVLAAHAALNHPKGATPFLFVPVLLFQATMGKVQLDSRNYPTNDSAHVSPALQRKSHHFEF